MVEYRLLPALIRASVDSNTDIQVRVLYMLTPAGWAWLVRSEAPPEDLRDEPPLGRDAADWHAERLQANLNRRDTAATCATKNIGAIPLPVAIEGRRLSGPWTPAAASA